MTSTTEQTETAQATETVAASPKKKANVGARRANVASAKPKSGKKATPAKKAPKSAKKAKGAKPAARDGSKTAKVLDLLKRSGGCDRQRAHESHWLAAAFGPWLSVRDGRQEDGIDGHLDQGGERTYSIKS